MQLVKLCRFKDVVECDRIVVKAFQSPHEVASFRASKLSDDFYHLKADFERRRTQMTREDITRDPTRDIMTGNYKMFYAEVLLSKSVHSCPAWQEMQR